VIAEKCPINWLIKRTNPEESEVLKGVTYSKIV
jgi:hypothetical protein